MLADSCLALSKVLLLLMQARGIKRSSSIYGLSLDYVVLSFLEFSYLTASTVGYLVPLTQRQYSRRFPTHPEIPISTIQGLIGATCTTVVLCLMLQCYKYRQTRHQFQFVSIYTKIFTCLTPTIAFWIYLNISHGDETKVGNYGFFFIDILDFLWYASQVASVFKWVPQITTNFLGLHFCELNKIPIFIEIQYSSITLVIRTLTDMREFHSFPINRDVYLTIALRLLVSMVLLYQLKIYGTSFKSLPNLVNIKDEERNE